MVIAHTGDLYAFCCDPGITNALALKVAQHVEWSWHLNSFFLFFGFWTTPWARVTPSSVLRNCSWRCLGDLMGCWRSNPGWLYERQKPCPQYCHSCPQNSDSWPQVCKADSFYFLPLLWCWGLNPGTHICKHLLYPWATFPAPWKIVLRGGRGHTRLCSGLTLRPLHSRITPNSRGSICGTRD